MPGSRATPTAEAPLRATVRPRVIETREEWVALRPAWERLIGRARQPSIFQSWEWLEAWIDVFLGERRLHVLLLEDDAGELLGAAPLYRDVAGDTSLRMIADEYVCSDYLDWPADADREEEATAGFVDQLASSPVAGALLLDAVAEDSFLHRRLLPVLETTAGFRSLELRADVCPRLPLPPGFKGAYTRKFKKLARSDGASIGYADSPETTRRDLRVLFRLHQANWTKRGETGSFDTEDKHRFYDLLADLLVPLDRLRLWHLRAGEGEIVAVNIGFALNGEWYGMQAGYAESWASKSVGAVLQGQVLGRLAAEGFGQVHFLRGDEQYKSEHWGAESFLQHSYRVFRRNAGNALRYQLPHVLRRWKRRARAWTGRGRPGGGA